MTNTVIVCVKVFGISGSMLETVLKQWEPQRTRQCNSHLNSSHPVYIVQTTGGDTNSAQSDFLCVCLSPFASHILASLVVWLQRQASSASSVASQRSFSKCSPSPHNSTLRAPLVCHVKTIFFHHLNKGNNECVIHNELLQWWKPYAVFLGSYSDVLWEFANVENISQGGRENSSSTRRNKGHVKDNGVTGILNPTVCLNLGNVILFTVDTRHYPQYDL